MTTHRLILIFMACVLALAGLAQPAAAAQLRYTFTGTGTGTLAGDGFDDRGFAIIGDADPANVAPCEFDGCRYLDFASTRVRIEGVGEFTVFTTLRVFNTRGNLGLSRGGAAGADLFNVFTVPADYYFSSAIGPITAFAHLLQWDLDAVLTAGGALAFVDAETDGTFGAKGVPLPASLWLLGTALLAVSRRRPVGANSFAH